MKVKSSVLSLLILSWLTCPLLAQDEEKDIPDSPFGYVQFITVHSDGDDVQIVETVPAEGEPVRMEYTVAIPYVEDGVTRIRHETRTRMAQPTKRVMQSVTDKVSFVRMDGSAIAYKDMVKEIPMTGLQVIVVPGEMSEEALESLKNLLRETTIIMKQPPVPMEK